LNKVTARGGLDDRYFMRITHTRSQKIALDFIDFNQKIDQKISTNMLFGDLFIEIFREGKIKERKKISRINCNLYFMDPDTLSLTFDSKEIKLERNDVDEFSITLHFQYFCLCHLKVYEDSLCRCSITRVS
jgi:hypothetical protein